MIDVSVGKATPPFLQQLHGDPCSPTAPTELLTGKVSKVWSLIFGKMSLGAFFFSVFCLNEIYAACFLLLGGFVKVVA